MRDVDSFGWKVGKLSGQFQVQRLSEGEKRGGGYLQIFLLVCHSAALNGFGKPITLQKI